MESRILGRRSGDAWSETSILEICRRSACILYIDCSINNSGNATGPINLDQENVYIGTISKDISTEFNGLIDGVRIYSYALSQAEIASLSANKEINQ